MPEAQELLKVFVHISQTLCTRWSDEVRTRCKLTLRTRFIDAACDRAIIGQAKYELEGRAP
eukprot:11244310-Alexandrium_andersonii.AAC.1